MSQRLALNSLLKSAFLLGTVIVLTPFAAVAQSVSDNGIVFRPQETIDEAFNREYFDHGKSVMDGPEVVRPASFILGVGGYPEHNIRRDAMSVDRLYNYVLERQANGDPTLRTADLVNPFNTSAQFLPMRAQASGNEFIPDQAAPMPVQRPIAEPIVPSPMPKGEDKAPRQPVEAKF